MKTSFFFYICCLDFFAILAFPRLCCAAESHPVSPTLSNAREPAPNFVWIIADDMSPDTGTYGATNIRTPHLDAVAAAGQRFTRAYTSLQALAVYFMPRKRIA